MIFDSPFLRRFVKNNGLKETSSRQASGAKQGLFIMLLRQERCKDHWEKFFATLCSGIKCLFIPHSSALLPLLVLFLLTLTPSRSPLPPLFATIVQISNLLHSKLPYSLSNHHPFFPSMDDQFESWPRKSARIRDREASKAAEAAKALQEKENELKHQQRAKRRSPPSAQVQTPNRPKPVQARATQAAHGNSTAPSRAAVFKATQAKVTRAKPTQAAPGKSAIPSTVAAFKATRATANQAKAAQTKVVQVAAASEGSPSSTRAAAFKAIRAKAEQVKAEQAKAVQAKVDQAAAAHKKFTPSSRATTFSVSLPSTQTGSFQPRPGPEDVDVDVETYAENAYVTAVSTPHSSLSSPLSSGMVMDDDEGDLALDQSGRDMDAEFENDGEAEGDDDEEMTSCLEMRTHSSVSGKTLPGARTRSPLRSHSPGSHYEEEGDKKGSDDDEVEGDSGEDKDEDGSGEDNYEDDERLSDAASGSSELEYSDEELYYSDDEVYLRCILTLSMNRSSQRFCWHPFTYHIHLIISFFHLPFSFSNYPVNLGLRRFSFDRQRVCGKDDEKAP